MTETDIAFFTMIVSTINMIASIILTIIIINQTRTNTEKQQKIEIEMNNQQKILQEKQQRIDAFPYKREVYSNLFTVFEQAQIIRDLIKDDMLKTKTLDQITQIYECMDRVNHVDHAKILYSLYESKYLFPKDISNKIIEVRNAFDEMVCKFRMCSIIPSLYENNLEAIKLEQINAIHTNLNIILGSISYLTSAIPKYIEI